HRHGAASGSPLPCRDGVPMVLHKELACAQAGSGRGRACAEAPRSTEKKARAGRLDLFFLDECGFSPTQPTGHTWSAPGKRYVVPFESPKGRRVNTLVAMRAPHPEPKLRFTV